MKKRNHSKTEYKRPPYTDSDGNQTCKADGSPCEFCGYDALMEAEAEARTDEKA